MRSRGCRHWIPLLRKLLLIYALSLAPLLVADDTLLQWMDGIAQQQLADRAAALAKIRTVRDAEARQAQVRAKILELLGGLPNYDGPLNARVTGRIDRPRYTIEKVIFESLPQFYVAANLYLPKEGGKHPGVLRPMGHWEEGKAREQVVDANLAMKGFVVLTYDPIGQGERQQAYDPRIEASLIGGSTDQHFQAGAQSILAGENFARYRIWDAKRALDYLVSLPEVDADKIGVTGCSGGGTLTTYISALDPRVKVAAPACYINTWHYLFPGPIGDSEQSFPFFLSSGLDVADYIEIFAPKPWLVVSTVGDFFPIDGARHAYQEALDWYRIFDAENKISWAVGPGPHGMPREVREDIYEWMIRWLKNGKGSIREEPFEPAPDFDLLASETGQVQGRQVYQVIAEGFHQRMSQGSTEQLQAEIHKWAGSPAGHAPSVRVVNDTSGDVFRTQQLALEVEPTLEIAAILYAPNAPGRKPAVLLVDLPAAVAEGLAARNLVVLNLEPRGLPLPKTQEDQSAAKQNIRAWLIGKNMAGLRAGDIMRGVDLLADRPDVDSGHVRAAARDVRGVWLLMAAAQDARIGKIWLDQTPHSLRAAIEVPITRDLHDAVIPGFALHWDLNDLVKAMAPRPVLWTDPSDWMRIVAAHLEGFRYRTFGEPDDQYWLELMK
ncbi:MAG TPA: acetylxylan esterase [Terriglobia bacterium]|nr:acetylxylan esterase [Terriglobia bacterium]